MVTLDDNVGCPRVGLLALGGWAGVGGFAAVKTYLAVNSAAERFFRRMPAAAKKIGAIRLDRVNFFPGERLAIFRNNLGLPNQGNVTLNFVWAVGFDDYLF